MSSHSDPSQHSDKRLIREVGLALSCKIALIALLGFFFFSSEHRIHPDAQSTAQAFLNPHSNPSSHQEKAP